EAAHRSWLSTFERLHHAPEKDWVAHGVHLASFAQTDVRFTINDEASEQAYVWWNRQCVPEFVLEQARLGRTHSGLLGHDHEFSIGVQELVGEEAWTALSKAIVS